MDGTLTHFLGGVGISEPIGVKDFTEELDRDRKERLISVKYAANLTFVLDGYEYLNDLFLASGYCAEATYEAYQDCQGLSRLAIRGVVKIADVKFNETTCEAEASIADDGVGARIIDNQEIPVSPGADLTKNGVALTPVTDIALQVFDPSGPAGTWNGTRKAWDWLEAIQHAALYVSDGQQTIISDWYTALPDDERYAVTSGYELRTGTGIEERVTWDFKSLFHELAKKYNLWLGVERVAGLPVLRIEPEYYWFSGAVAVTLPSIQDFVRSADPDQLYAKVAVGGKIGKRILDTSLSLGFLPLRGHTKEEYQFQGVCNTDETLDLVNDWIIDSNVIEDIYTNSVDDHDDELVLIQYTLSTSRATKGDYFTPGAGPYLYNEQLQNGLVLARYPLPSAAGAVFNSTAANFQAHRTAPAAPIFYGAGGGTSAPAIFHFDHDYSPLFGDYDPTNAWGNGTVQGTPVSQANSRYTAQGDGFFQFHFSLRWRIILNDPQVLAGISQLKYARFRILAERYDAGNTLISTQVIVSDTEGLVGIYDLMGDVGIAMNIGDYFQLRYEIDNFVFQGDAYNMPGSGGPPGITVQIGLHPSYLQTIFVEGGGYVPGNGEGRIITYSFDRFIDLGTWVSLTADPRQAIMVGPTQTADRTTHCLNAKRNVFTGECSWEVIADP